METYSKDYLTETHKLTSNKTLVDLIGKRDCENKIRELLDRVSIVNMFIYLICLYLLNYISLE